MTLSIIIPTFNSATVIKRALDSIVCQTFTDYEVMVMDNVSTDSTISVVQSYMSERILLYSEPDRGIYDAMNKGIKKAHGEWLYFLGSDDYLLNENVLETVFGSDIFHYDVVYGDVDNEMGIYNGEWRVETIGYNRCHQAIFYKKSLFDKLGYYNTKYTILADHAFNIRWFFGDEVNHKYIPVQIAHFTPGGISGSSLRDKWPEDEYMEILELGYGKLPYNERIWMMRQVLISRPDLPALMRWKYKFLILSNIFTHKIGRMFYHHK